MLLCGCGLGLFCTDCGSETGPAYVSSLETAVCPACKISHETQDLDSESESDEECDICVDCNRDSDNNSTLTLYGCDKCNSWVCHACVAKAYVVDVDYILAMSEGELENLKVVCKGCTAFGF